MKFIGPCRSHKYLSLLFSSMPSGGSAKANFIFNQKLLFKLHLIISKISFFEKLIQNLLNMYTNGNYKKMKN